MKWVCPECDRYVQGEKLTIGRITAGRCDICEMPINAGEACPLTKPQWKQALFARAYAHGGAAK